MGQLTRVVGMDDAGQTEALARLDAGQVIAFPTDTVYGVGADGLNDAAIEQLYTVKDRPVDKAIPYLLAEISQAEALALTWPPEARALAARFWPGALSIVVPAQQYIPAVLRAQHDSVALRIPNHDWLRELIRRLGRPIAATSANRSGGSDSLTAAEVVAQLAGRLALVVDGGRTRGSQPSTVVDLTKHPIQVIREGSIARAEIDQVLASIRPTEGRDENANRD